MKKIYFKGYYGFKNLGDDIFTVTAEWICNNIWKNRKPIFIGHSLPDVSNKTIKVEIKNGLLRRIIELIVCIFSRRIIYFGGSLFTGGGTSFKDLKYYLRKIPYLSNKTGTIGTSLGPFKNSNEFNQTRDLLNKFKFVSVRDYSSEKIGEEMQIDERLSFCFDNAILIKEVYPDLTKHRKRSDTDKIKLAISLCRYESIKGGDIKDEHKREESIKSFLDNVLDKHRNIEELVFIVFNGNPKYGDLEITKQFNDYFCEKVKTRIVNYTNNTKHMIEEMNNCDLVFGVRLHSGILAYALEKPFMLVEYHAKCTEFLNTINHDYRYNVNDIDYNIENFEAILNENKVPNIVRPDKFKNIMIKELKKLEKSI
ncbi:polysaccharide pyruvyl transferase family protein [Bacillus sp. 2205SS5-2]|uniref:polysaccharide pyruvyl transferase family protein n=1 Tax=Bacillus sp. 2205SS5-2 TaxID=3109031 RepID=UPI00300689D3